MKLSKQSEKGLKALLSKKTMIILAILALLGSMIVHADSYASTQSESVMISLLNQDPNPARAGDIVTIRFKLENHGGNAAENIKIEVLQDYPFSIASESATKSFEILDPYQNGKYYTNFEFTVKIDKDASQGQIPLQVRYKYGNYDWSTASFSINVASKEFAQIIYVDKAKLAPGKETNMTFTITNIGNAPLQNMIFSWNEPKGYVLPVYSSDTKYVKYLDAGESVELNYIVVADVNAAPGLYQLDLTLKSESLTNATASVLSTKAGVLIGGETDFDVAFSESSAGQTSLSVSNTGNNPAQSVSVKIPQQENFMVSGTNSAIIGNLDKGDYTLVSFQITQAAGFNASQVRTGARTSGTQPQGTQPQSNTGAGRNLLKVDIDYTDTTGERRTVEKMVPIQFRALTGTTGTSTSAYGNGRAQTGFLQAYGVWIILIVLAIIIVFLIALLRSKPLREKMAGIFKRKSK